MLTRMGIQNFALIEQVELFLQDGITVFTGETGAGKSILMDAFSILLGERASSEFIRHGKDYFLLEGTFSIGNNEKLKSFLEFSNLSFEEEELILSRYFSEKGKSVIKANDQVITLKTLRHIGSLLADIHGQYQSQDLLDTSTHVQLLDRCNGEARQAYEIYRELYDSYKKLERELQKIDALSSERIREIEILNWQIEEIEAANILPKEDENIEAELRQLDNYDQLTKTVTGCMDALYNGDSDIMGNLNKIKESLKQIARHTPDLKNVEELIASSYFQLEEAVHELQKYEDTLTFSEERYRYCQERDSLLYNLKKKYGPTLSEVKDFMNNAQERLDFLESQRLNKDELEEKLKDIIKPLKIAHDKLNQVRMQNAENIAFYLREAVAQLGMEEANFSFLIETESEFTPLGSSQIELLFSANIGEPMLSLAKIASGGELSRIALACKSVFVADIEKTLVFDEIDVGISGEAALKVAQRMYELGQNRQVLCITHMPQTASIAEYHYHLDKRNVDGRTSSIVLPLSEEDHARHIAMMFAGSAPSEKALEAAEDLLKRFKVEYKL